MKCIDRAMWSYLHTLCLKLGQQRLQLLAQLPGGQIRKMCEEHCQAHMVCPIGLQCATAQGQALRLLRGIRLWLSAQSSEREARKEAQGRAGRWLEAPADALRAGL